MLHCTQRNEPTNIQLLWQVALQLSNSSMTCAVRALRTYSERICYT